MLKNLSKRAQIGLTLGLAVLAYLVLMPILFPEPPTPTASRKPAIRKSTAAKTIYTKEDMTAHFDPINVSVKNSFKPLVMKTETLGGGITVSAKVNILPPEFAGGEANWSYTGTVEIDGLLQALIENKATGEGVFLKAGDTWKGISVEEITDETLVLAAPSGNEKTLRLASDDTVNPPAAAPAAGFAPARVSAPLRGAIGNLNIRPDRNASQDATFGDQG